MTAAQKAIKLALQNQTDVVPEKITCRANGSVEVRRSFFYRHNSNAEKWAARVASVLEAAGLPVTVWGEEEWAAWPKTSYFCAVVTPKSLEVTR